MNDDALIDRVARDMTDGEPPGDFRARVIERLPQSGRGSWLRIAIPAGAITGLGLAWILAGPTAPAGPATFTGPTGSIAPAGLGGPAGPVALAGSAAPVDVAGPAEPAGSVAPAESSPAALEPLSAPEPIVIAPIQPILPSIAPITVDPLGWDPVPLAPLESRTGGRD